MFSNDLQSVLCVSYGNTLIYTFLLIDHYFFLFESIYQFQLGARFMFLLDLEKIQLKFIDGQINKNKVYNLLYALFGFNNT